jgi:hypothetical protein
MDADVILEFRIIGDKDAHGYAGRSKLRSSSRRRTNAEELSMIREAATLSRFPLGEYVCRRGDTRDFARRAAALPDADIEIVEKHHRKSSTRERTALMIAI